MREAVRLLGQMVEDRGRVVLPPERMEPVSSVSSGQSGQAQIIVDQEGTFRRETHPLLFRVVDLLSEDKTKRKLSVRALAEETEISKSWAAVAKRYWQRVEKDERDVQ